MVESKSGLSPVAVRRHGNPAGLHVSVRDHHVRAEMKHQLKHEHSNATSSSTSSTAGAVVGASSSNAHFVSASKDAVKKLKGKETEFSNRNFVDLTADSPRKDETRSAFAVDNPLSGLSFLRGHHRINRSHRLPLVPNEGNIQGPLEGDMSMLGSGSRPRLEPDRGCSNWRASLPSGEINIEEASNQKRSEMGDLPLNASSSGAFCGERTVIDRHLLNLNDKSSGSQQSGNSKGQLSVTPGVDHQTSGPLSRPEPPLSWKRKRYLRKDADKSRQRFKPPRMVHGGGTSGSSFGGMQLPIEVDNLEDSGSSGVENASMALERARQIEEDEMLAKFLQHEYGLEAAGESFNMDDAQLAQMLQDRENALSLQQRDESMSQAMNATTLQATRREARRVSTTARSPAARPTASSSRMRILRNLHNRSSQHVIRSHRLGGGMMNASDNLIHFPGGLGLEARVEFLAALETASEAGFPMLHQVDRDFNEDDYEMLLALDDTNHAHSGASYDKIEQLPVSVIKPTDVFEETCSICLETPVVDDVVRRLPCMHAFHLQCIDEWLERQANCPICKMEL